MAAIGMKYLTFAPVDTETDSSITYTTGVLAEHARRGDISYEWDESDYYGDDMMVDHVKKMTGYTATVEMTNIDPDLMVLLGLEEKITTGTGSSATYSYELVEGAEVNVGWGFMQTLRIDGEESYRAYWFYKTTFSPANANAKTREKTIEWGSPTMDGKGWGVHTAADAKVRFRVFEDFDTEAKALAWLKAKAGIS